MEITCMLSCNLARYMYVCTHFHFSSCRVCEITRESPAWSRQVRHHWNKSSKGEENG